MLRRTKLGIGLALFTLLLVYAPSQALPATAVAVDPERSSLVVDDCDREAEPSDGAGGATLGTLGDPCVCDIYALPVAWEGFATFSYEIVVDNQTVLNTERISGSLNATLVHEVGEYALAATAWASASGSASVDVHYSFKTGQGPILRESIVGSRHLNPYTPPTGSRLFVNFDLVDCRYNVYGRAEITATRIDSLGSVSEDVMVAAFSASWMPLPSWGDLTLRGSGQYPVLSDFYSAASLPETWLVSLGTDVHAPWVRPGELGTATVSWGFTPIMPAEDR